MVLVGVLLELALAVLVMLVVASLIMVGPASIGSAVRNFRWRLESVSLPLGVLLGVLALRWATRDFAHDVSWRIFGINITPYLFRIDRTVFGESPVVYLQSLQFEGLTTYFVFIYIYGYAFLLLFPFLAYFVLDEMDDLSSFVFTVAINYGVGLLLYIVFIAYGPRNVDPILFENLLYSSFPKSGLLTHSVNQNTNVFPSLHTSMAMTVFFFAVRTRETYPLWAFVSGVLAVSVALSTMYLGIHWFSDVVAGTILAIVSVHIGTTYTVERLLEDVRSTVTV